MNVNELINILCSTFHSKIYVSPLILLDETVTRALISSPSSSFQHTRGVRMIRVRIHLGSRKMTKQTIIKHNEEHSNFIGKYYYYFIHCFRHLKTLSFKEKKNHSPDYVHKTNFLNNIFSFILSVNKTHRKK
jgi:hypothetical protein